MTKEVSELAALAAQAETIETAATEDAQAGQGAAPAPVVQTNTEIAIGFLQVGRDLGCVVTDLKSPRYVLNDPACEKMGGLLGAVADKRGWDFGKVMGEYALELAAAAMAFSLGMSLQKAISAELAAKAGQKEAEAKPSPEAAHAV